MRRLVWAFLVLAVPMSWPGSGAAVTPEGQLIVTDPVWSEEPADHNTFPPTDLTELRIVNGPDELWIDIPFQSDWAGLQLHVLLETHFNAAGAAADPFLQPVIYGHALRPDYAVTCKYSSNDYGDFRRWNVAGARWERYDAASGEYSMEYGSNIVPLWTDKSDDLYTLRIPWGPFGGRPDSLLVAAYLTQEIEGTKRSAFDSVPSDATLDLDFDYNNPAPGDWGVALGPVTLRAWSPVYRVRSEFPATPQIPDAAVMPDTVASGGSVLLTADVLDMGAGIGAVVANLAELGGPAEAPLYDDGASAHGDVVAGDGRFSRLWTVPECLFSRDYQIAISAYDVDDLQHATAGCALTVLPGGAPLIHAEDPVGDDHGPNQPGVPRLYYTYPTNAAFVAGAFDLTMLEVRRVRTSVGGMLKDWLAFTVGLRAFAGPGETGYVNWNPYYAGLCVAKIDILVDARSGGSVASLPNRQAGYQSWDAWEYAIVIDGWAKAVIPYRGSDELADWLADARTSDADIVLLGDTHGNTASALVDPAILGDPSDAEIRGWDICVQAASHDFGGPEVFGGVRWVHQSASEWGFGGGHDSDRDANLLDLLLTPGTGRSAGRAQEYLLDCWTDEAQDRLLLGLEAVAIEVTAYPVAAAGPEGIRRASLAQNVPNPFNPSTTIGFDLPVAATVDLRVFDVGGRFVRTLLAQAKVAAGAHAVVWDGADDSGRPVASGTYYYRLESAEFTATGKAVLLK